jgi:hypothetical protein
VFVPGKHFQSSLMFVGKAISLPERGTPLMCITAALLANIRLS